MRLNFLLTLKSYQHHYHYHQNGLLKVGGSADPGPGAAPGAAPVACGLCA